MSHSWDGDYISPGEFSHISIEYLTPCSVIGKIQWDVLAKDSVHGLVEDGVPSLEIVAT
jgi:hypothetical protein